MIPLIAKESPGQAQQEKRRIEHEDFVVQIGPGREGELTVRVVVSPAGEGEAPFHLPWTGPEWLRLRAGLRSAARHLALDETPSDSLAPRQIGEALFRALFAGQIGDLFSRSLGMAGDRGLRLRLRFRLAVDDPRLATLHSLPWELLYQPDTRDLLGLSRQTPIVRSLEIPRPAPPLPLPSPLRILVVPGSLAGLPSLELERERRQIDEAWAGLAGAEVVVLDRPGTAALREALLAGPFHILHFMGHGELDPATGEGVLFLNGPDGARLPLSGEALATLLKDIRTLRLVFLNACETGRAPDGPSQDPYAGVATALVLGGVPSVIAMQLPIADPAALTFSRTVYQRLAAGDPADIAVTEGRQALYLASPDRAEWAIPVLFTRRADGRLFALGPTHPSRRRQLSWAAASVLLALLASFAVRNIHRLDRLIPFPGRSDLVFETARVEDFSIARYEVTQREYLRFVQANPEWRKDEIPRGYHDGDYLKDWISSTEYPPGLDDHPVTWVSWFAADAFCRWVGGRLPTREEWQTAAHLARHPFPWGPNTRLDGPSPLNFCDADCDRQHRDATFLPTFRDGFPRTAPVTALPDGRTPEGVYNLSGNVWEWCLNPSQDERVTMGGSYLATFEECSTDRPSWEEANACLPDGGFRCVWE